jgi:hypothetical protein
MQNLVYPRKPRYMGTTIAYSRPYHGAWYCPCTADDIASGARAYKRYAAWRMARRVFAWRECGENSRMLTALPKGAKVSTIILTD